jgi:mannonate dehydratase
MKLGLGLYRHMLDRENFQFARQAGATHIVAHLVDYFRSGSRGAHDQPIGADTGWGRAGNPNQLWTVDELKSLRRDIESAGLELAAIENFDPAHWHDILLDGPRKREHYENIKTIVRRVGEAGIPIIGYNFSIAGVCGRVKAPFARGGALSVGMDGPFDTPMPRGMAWNMIYESDPVAGIEPPVTHDVLWQRLSEFLDEILPIAEEAGVTLAAHPDDPPMPTMRGQPRLVYQPAMYQRLLDLHPSRASALEFCIGTLAEMIEGNVYDATAQYCGQGKLAYVHFRNIRGKVPHYGETFVDDGDIDMLRVLQILKANDFRGVLIPDHTPQMICGAPWHAGMAYALGYMRCALQTIGIKESTT